MNIGLVYFDRGRLEDELVAYQKALVIHEEIGNPLGQANDLVNIGLVYFDQGKLEAALKSYQEARVIFLNLGALRELQIVTRNIELLNTAMK